VLNRVFCAFTDFVEIEGGLKDVMHEIKNFVFNGLTDPVYDVVDDNGNVIGKHIQYSFGSEITVENHLLKYIGIDNYGNKVLWNVDKKHIELGFMESDKINLSTPKISLWKQFLNLLPL